MEYITDRKRHLICLPYSIDNLHKMAKELGINRKWFEVSKLGHAHYDIPKRRIKEIEAKCRIVSPKDIVRIIKGYITEI